MRKTAPATVIQPQMSLVPRMRNPGVDTGTAIKGLRTPGSENLAASPATPITSVGTGKAFLPNEETFRRPPTLRRPPGAPRFKDSARTARFRRKPQFPTAQPGAGPPAAAVAPPNRLPTAPSAGRWAGWGGGPVRMRAHARGCGAGLARGPAQARRLRPPHLPTSSAWRRRCVRRGLPRVLRAGAAHWSLVLEAAAAAAAAPVAPPPPLVAVAPRARAPAPLSATPRAPSSPGAAGNMRLRSRRPASE
uniref:protein transport protein sec31-like n=1 Tax=Halichoerus grypus TaxID=9711 RepID=UPI001659AF00|nr:protein transport protein sec31-like [Halichoerus grypus]